MGQFFLRLSDLLYLSEIPSLRTLLIAGFYFIYLFVEMCCVKSTIYQQAILHALTNYIKIDDFVRALTSFRIPEDNRNLFLQVADR